MCVCPLVYLLLMGNLLNESYEITEWKATPLNIPTVTQRHKNYLDRSLKAQKTDKPLIKVMALQRQSMMLTQNGEGYAQFGL